MEKQYVLVCENENDYFEITNRIKETGYKDKTVEIICNPPCSINKYEGVIGVYDKMPHNNCKILNNWVGHSHLRTVWGENKETKKKMLYEVLCHMLGIPAPVEIERKFLIKMPDIKKLSDMENCKGVEISQVYLDIPDKNVRIRQRNGIFIKTEKSKITDITRYESECEITKNEYNELLKYRHPLLETVTKTRYCLLWMGKYYEIDIFPFWNEYAYLEIELMSEDEKFIIPDFIEIVKEVTFDKKYTNKSIAQYLSQGKINELF